MGLIIPCVSKVQGLLLFSSYLTHLQVLIVSLSVCSLLLSSPLVGSQISCRGPLPLGDLGASILVISISSLIVPSPSPSSSSGSLSPSVNHTSSSLFACRVS